MSRCLLAAVLVLSLTACGSRTGDSAAPPTAEPEPVAGTWTVHELGGTPGVDFAPVLESDAEQGLLVAFLSDEGVLQTHTSTDGGSWAAGEPLDTGVAFAGLAGAAPYDGGWLALGSGGTSDDGEDLEFGAFALRSADGSTWEEEPVTGFAGPVDIADVVSVGDSLVAVGAYRTARDPSSGGFRAAAWTSSDGTSWTEVALPGAGGSGDSSVARLAVVGDRLLAGGSAGGRAALWASDDGGASWATVDLALGGEDRVRSVVGLAGSDDVGDLAVATLEDGRILRSTDGGEVWTPAQAGPGPEERELEGWAPLWTGGGRFWTAVSGSVLGTMAPEHCYVDPEQGCPTGEELGGFYASDDGDSWSRIDTTGLPGTGGDVVGDLVGTPDGGLVVLGHAQDGTPAVSTYPAGAQLPTEPEPTLPTADVTEVPASGPEVGVRYAVPIYLHCDSEWLYLGDTPWQRVGPEWSETGGGSYYGFATLTASDRLDYTSADGDVLAEYRLTDQRPPGCA